jgi:hypothetical protein
LKTILYNLYILKRKLGGLLYELVYFLFKPIRYVYLKLKKTNFYANIQKSEYYKDEISRIYRGIDYDGCALMTNFTDYEGYFCIDSVAYDDYIDEIKNKLIKQKFVVEEYNCEEYYKKYIGDREHTIWEMKNSYPYKSGRMIKITKRV